MTRKNIGSWLAIGATVTLVLAPATAVLAGIGEELTLAQTHALLAYRTGGRGERGIAQGHMHFQHVLNCLVGKGGSGYDLTPPVMPAGRGRGAAGDAADAPPAPDGAASRDARRVAPRETPGAADGKITP